MLDTSVRYYDSTMAGAPALSGTPGALISVLDACLKDDFGTVTLNSLVVAGNVATGTVNAGHGFTMVGGAVGPVITIAGATPAGLNGTWRIASVPNSTTFTFATSGIADQTATGTITAKRAPLGFSKVFSGTNKAVYRADDVASSRMYLRIDDTGAGSATYARVRGYESMSDVDTGTGLFPTDAQLSGGGYAPKSSAASSAARPWRLIGDAMGFVLMVNYDAGANWVGWLFGDIASEKSPDAYRTLLIVGTTTTLANQCRIQACNYNDGHFMPRAHTQTGTAIQVIKLGHVMSYNWMGYSGIPYPDSINNRLLCSSVDVWEGGTLYSNVATFRGVLPGIYAPAHIASSLAEGSFHSAISGLEGRTLMVQKPGSAGTTYAFLVDISGPWR